MAAVPSFPTGKIFCDRHPHFKASAIADCGHFHRLCAQCIYVGVFEPAAEYGDDNTKQIPCPICKQTIRNVKGLVKNKKEITKAFLRLGIAEKRYVDPEFHLPLPTELYAELMRFLDMGSLRKVAAITRLPFALFGEKMRKWNARNVWVYSLSKNLVDEARQRQIFEISQHGLSVRSKENVNHVFANVVAKKPFKLLLANLAVNDTSATTPVHHIYFEIRVDKSTGPIIFGLVGGQKQFDEEPKMLLKMGMKMAQLFPEPWRNIGRLAERRRREGFGLRRRLHFLANDIGAWPNRREWQHMSLGFFAERNLVPAAAAEKFTDGDVLGCGLLHFSTRPLQELAQFFPDEKPMHHQLFFTRNGQLFGEPIWVSPDNDNELFPFVGLVNAGTSVTGNFGDLEKFPYAYNIGQHIGPIGIK